LIQGSVAAHFAWGEIMSYGVSIYSLGHNAPVASEVLREISREQTGLPGTIVNSARSRREGETQLIMDRLLREYLRPKIAVRDEVIPGNLLNLHTARRGGAS
jgi:hypothetical protein